MSEKGDKPNERLEALLRQWGADEAGQVAKAHLASAPAPATVGSVLLRWAPAAAAAVLLIAAGTMFLVWQLGDKPSASDESAPRAAQMAPPEATAADLKADIQKLATANEMLKSERDDLKASLLEADGLRLAAVEIHKAELGKLQAKLDAGSASLTTAVAEAKKARQAMDAKAAELVTVTAARDKAQTDLKASGKEIVQLKGTVDDLTRRGEQLKAEYGAAAEALATANEKVAAELAAEKRRNERLVAEFGRLYLAVGAPGEMGLAARKTTADRMRLAERGAALRRKCDDDEIKDLIDRVDVALTRLAMIDAGDPASSQRFTALVQKAGLEARIDRTLAMAPKQPGLRTWLRETRMILAGVGDVG